MWFSLLVLTSSVHVYTYLTSKDAPAIHAQVTSPFVQYKLRTAAAQQIAVGNTDMPMSKIRRTVRLPAVVVACTANEWWALLIVGIVDFDCQL